MLPCGLQTEKPSVRQAAQRRLGGGKGKPGLGGGKGKPGLRESKASGLWQTEEIRPLSTVGEQGEFGPGNWGSRGCLGQAGNLLGIS